MALFPKILPTILPPKVPGGIFRNLAGRSPGLFASLGVLSVLLPEVFFPREKFGLLPGSISALLLLAAGFFFYYEKRAFLLFAGSGLLAFLTFFAGERSDKRLEEILAQPLPVGVEMLLTVRDPGLVPELLPNPRTILIKVDALRFPGEEKYHILPGEDPLMLLLPSRFPPLAYGEKLECKGSISQADPAFFPGGFSYRDYLQKRGIPGIARPNDLRKTGKENNFFTCLYQIRSLCMEKVLSRIRCQEFRALSCAILFGCRQGISRETKEEMIQSGLIHILTVSGLHIGLFASLMGLLFLGVPYKLRYFLIIFFSFLYTLATGFGLPAVRALIMISFYCAGRAFYGNQSPVNALSFAFAVLLLWQKDQLLQPGFLYSFSATAILLLSGGFFRRNRLFFREKSLWMRDPVSPFSGPKDPFPGKLLFSFLSCLAAWMTTGVLSLHFQGIHAIFSPLANLLLLPVIWLFYPVFLAGTCLGFLWENVWGMTGILLEYLCAILKVAASLVSHGSFLVPPPGVWLTAFMLFVLFLPFLLPRRQMEVLLLFTLPLFLVFNLYLFAPFAGRDGKIALLEGGGASGNKLPALLYSSQQEPLAFAVNPAGPFPLPRDMAEYFKRRGHRELLFIVVTGTRKEDLEGLAYFLEKIPVKNLLLPRPSRNARAAKELLHKAEKLGTRISFLPDKHSRHTFRIAFQYGGRAFTFQCDETFLLLTCNGKTVKRERRREMLPQLTFFPVYKEPGKAKNPSAFLEVTLPHSSTVIPLHSATTLAI